MPMCHLNAVHSLRLIKTLVPPEQRLLHHKLYQVIKSRYIGAWEAIAGLPNLQSLFVRDTLYNQKLHWECFGIKAAGADGTGGLWDGIHPAFCLIAMNATMNHASVRRQMLTEMDLMAWIDQFAPAPLGLGFNSADARDGAKRLRLYERPWPQAQYGEQGLRMSPRRR
jgi:hypothetical protein